MEPGGQTVILNRNMTVRYVRESDYIQNGLMDQQETVGKMMEIQTPKTSFDTVEEVTKTSHEKLPPMPEK